MLRSRYRFEIPRSLHSAVRALVQNSPDALRFHFRAIPTASFETALRECQGRVFGPSGAAAILGIARSTLESKIRSLNINKNRFKS
jgi:transcriptional regulator of acetoin/glycerol metabolism